VTLQATLHTRVCLNLHKLLLSVTHMQHMHRLMRHITHRALCSVQSMGPAYWAWKVEQGCMAPHEGSGMPDARHVAHATQTAVTPCNSQWLASPSSFRSPGTPCGDPSQPQTPSTQFIGTYHCMHVSAHHLQQRQRRSCNSAGAYLLLSPPSSVSLLSGLLQAETP